MADQLLPYYLARTFLSVRGTKKTVKDLESGLDGSSSEASIELGVEADPDDYYLLDLEQSELTDMDFTLEFTDDLRLRSANSVVTGRGSSILEGAAKIVGTFAAPGFASIFRATDRFDLTLMMDSMLGEDGAGSRDAPAPELPTYPGQERRAAAKKTASKLSARIVQLGNQAAAGSPDKDELEATMKALEAVRAEIALIEAHHAAWQARERNVRDEQYSFRIPIDHVPERSALSDKTPKKGLKGDAVEMFQALSMVVAHETDSEASPDGTAPGSGHVVESIWYRRPYYTDLLLMRFTNGAWQEEDRTRQLVVGQNAPKTELPIKKSAWGKRTLDVEFSELGTAIKIATSESSATADAIAALSGVPGHVSSGLDSAAAFEAAVAGVPDARVARAIARLENEKKRVLAELGDDAAADAALVAEVARLENEKKRLTLLKDLGRNIS